mmetsp:Transcript_21602/g.45115  ORF Transcript_21602/g.45115 Transcript_21602/m.45115 type:complete len:87 (-) Transcript_21602:124-384(-)
MCDSRSSKVKNECSSLDGDNMSVSGRNLPSLLLAHTEIHHHFVVCSLQSALTAGRLECRMGVSVPLKQIFSCFCFLKSLRILPGKS